MGRTGATASTLDAGATGAYVATVTDSAGVTSPPSLPVAVSVYGQPTISGAAPPRGELGVAYAATIATRGGTPPLTWSRAGALPLGIAFASGAFTGTPTRAGAFPLTLTVTGAGGCTVSRDVTIVVSAPAGVPAPDLLVGAVSVPAAASTGQTISVRDTTWNRGTEAAASSLTGYWFSTDTVRSRTDVRAIAKRAVPPLAAGASSTGTYALTVPPTLTAGSYFVLVCADDTRLVDESNEANNCHASPAPIAITVGGP